MSKPFPEMGFASAGRIITQTLSNMFQKFKSVPAQEAFGMFWMVSDGFFGMFWDSSGF